MNLYALTHRFVMALLLNSADISAGQTDTASYQLEPIVVTGTRMPIDWLDAPVALTVIPQSVLKQSRGYGVDELLSTVPGVLAQSRSGSHDVRLTVRGFGARGAGERSNAGTSRGIRVLLDGFPETEPDGRTAFDLVDLSYAGSVEVVRSNVSSIWGNAAGGVINVLSNTSFTTPFAATQVTFGSFGYRKDLLTAGAMIGSGRLFLTLSNTNFDGWRTHSRSARSLLNAGVVSPIGARTTLGLYLTAASNLFRIPGPLTQAQFDADPQRAQDSAFNGKPSYIQRDERRFDRLGRLGFKLAHDFDSGNSLSASVFVGPKYLQRSERNSFRDFTRYHVGGSALYRHSSTLGSRMKNTLMLGMDEAYQDGAILFHNLVDGQRGTTTRDNKREGANNLGLFIENQLTIDNRSTVLFGGRYDDIVYYYDDYLRPQRNDRKSFRRFTPKVGMSYRLNEKQSIYLSIGGGVEAPAGNETDPAPTNGLDTATTLNPLLKPIRSTTFELGIKHIVNPDGERFLRRLTYDIALYWIEVRDDIVPYESGGFYFTAGKTRRQGLEASMVADLSSGVSVQGAVTFSRNRYVQYLIDSAYSGFHADYRDNKIAGTPDFFFRTSLRYAPRWVSGVSGEISAQGVSGYFADDANSVAVPAYIIANAAFMFQNLYVYQRHLALNGSIALNNLTNRQYAASAFVNPDRNIRNEPIFLEPGLPRNWTVLLSLRWDF